MTLRYIDPALEVCAAVVAHEPFVPPHAVDFGAAPSVCVFCGTEDRNADTEHDDECAYRVACELVDDGGNPAPRKHPLIQLLTAIEQVAEMDVDEYLDGLDLPDLVRLLRWFRGDKDDPQTGAKRQLGYLEQAVEDHVIRLTPYTDPGSPRPEVDGVRVVIHSGKQIIEVDKDLLVGAWTEAVWSELVDVLPEADLAMEERDRLRDQLANIVRDTLQFGGAGGPAFKAFRKTIAEDYGIDVGKYVREAGYGRKTVELG